MNPDATLPAGAVHPSPQRSRVGKGAIAFGLCAAPLAWSLQLLFNASFAGRACFPKDVPLPVPTFGSLHALVLAIDGVALVVCVVAVLVAWRSWKKTANERPGSAHHLIESGDGRSRFMALAGVMTSLLFFVAIAFATLNVVAIAACGG